MKIDGSYILVEVEKLLEDTIHAPGGMEFALDNSFEPRKYKRCYGTVYASPERFDKSIEVCRIEENVLQSHESYQYYKPKVFTSSDIPHDIKKGERVWFYYTSTEDNMRINIDGKDVYRMICTDIICVIRDGKPEAVNGHILVKPYYGDGVESIDVDGHSMVVRKSHGMIVETNIKPIEQTGTVTHLCKPLKGDEIGFKEEDVIYFKHFANLSMKIEGEEYYVMRYWDVLATIEI